MIEQSPNSPNNHTKLDHNLDIESSPSSLSHSHQTCAVSNVIHFSTMSSPSNDSFPSPQLNIHHNESGNNNNNDTMNRWNGCGAPKNHSIETASVVPQLQPQELIKTDCSPTPSNRRGASSTTTSTNHSQAIMSFVDETTKVKCKVKINRRNKEYNIKKTRLRKPLQNCALLQNYFEWNKAQNCSEELTVYKMLEPPKQSSVQPLQHYSTSFSDVPPSTSSSTNSSGGGGGGCGSVSLPNNTTTLNNDQPYGMNPQEYFNRSSHGCPPQMNIVPEYSVPTRESPTFSSPHHPINLNSPPMSLMGTASNNQDIRMATPSISERSSKKKRSKHLLLSTTASSSPNIEKDLESKQIVTSEKVKIQKLRSNTSSNYMSTTTTMVTSSATSAGASSTPPRPAHGSMLALLSNSGHCRTSPSSSNTTFTNSSCSGSSSSGSATGVMSGEGQALPTSFLHESSRSSNYSLVGIGSGSGSGGGGMDSSTLCFSRVNHECPLSLASQPVFMNRSFRNNHQDSCAVMTHTGHPNKLLNQQQMEHEQQQQMEMLCNMIQSARSQHSHEFNMVNPTTTTNSLQPQHVTHHPYRTVHVPSTTTTVNTTCSVPQHVHPLTGISNFQQEQQQHPIVREYGQYSQPQLHQTMNTTPTLLNSSPSSFMNDPFSQRNTLNSQQPYQRMNSFPNETLNTNVIVQHVDATTTHPYLQVPLDSSQFQQTGASQAMSGICTTNQTTATTHFQQLHPTPNAQPFPTTHNHHHLTERNANEFCLSKLVEVVNSISIPSANSAEGEKLKAILDFITTRTEEILSTTNHKLTQQQEDSIFEQAYQRILSSNMTSSEQFSSILSLTVYYKMRRNERDKADEEERKRGPPQNQHEYL
ncbi:hypothetical protein C9374_014028 [Naegleria lovaniensis]|uniref:Uncharacterized protein n=1 Tax=Naegleria lovaniensis TaxID=51637 RepID=A0AA88KPH8_NAELO|nr:uncharacterized protein C9374_014028 [Naegleria lovaniensis]KAG2389468.1 hypothetical protein C9374_014028 [Naegleria lovaniensis]